MSRSEERFPASESGHYTPRESMDRRDKERRGFWGTRDKDKDKERGSRDKQEQQLHARTQAVPRDREPAERGREGARKDDDQAELTRMIGG